MYLVVPEVLASVTELDQDRVCDSLARKGSASSSESHRDCKLSCNRQNALHLLLCVNLDHELGIKTVEASVCAVGKSPDWVGELSSLGNKGRDLVDKRRVSAILNATTVHVGVHVVLVLVLRDNGHCAVRVYNGVRNCCDLLYWLC